MKKTIILITAILFGITSYAQQIQSQRIIELPRLGMEKQELLHWHIANDSLCIYAFNHIRGIFVEKTKAEIAALAEKLSAKEKVTNVLATMISYGNQSAKGLMLHEIKIPTNLQVLSDHSMTYMVDQSANTDPEVQGYFKPSSGMKQLNITKEQIGRPTDFSVHDLPTRFPLLPKLNTTIQDRYFTKTEGDGILGVKNIKTHLKHEESALGYGSANGFTTETSDFRVFALETLVPNTFTHIKGSFMKGDNGIMQAWFTKNKEDKKDQRVHEGVTFDLKKKILQRIPFEASFSKKSLGHVPIFDVTTHQVVGFLSIFGYDKKAKKDKRGEDFSKFYALVSDTEGNTNTIEFNTGDKKTYKNAIDPVTAYQDDKGLILYNIKGGTLFKGGDLEAVRLSTTGELTVLKSLPTFNAFEASSLMYLREDYNDVQKTKRLGSARMRIANSTKDETEYIKSRQGSDIPKSVRYYDGLNVSLLQADYTFQNRHIAFPITKNPLHIFPLIETDTEVKYMINGGNQYGILTVTSEEIHYTRINFDDKKYEYMIGHTASNYFALDTGNNVLVDSKNRTAYIQHQYYKEKGNDTMLFKMVITAITF